jgi:hypothetical protein
MWRFCGGWRKDFTVFTAYWVVCGLQFAIFCYDKNKDWSVYVIDQNDERL